MGIPSYFSYIIKNYSNIISNLSKLHNYGVSIDNLFMDCNSIIYDVFNNFNDEEKGFSIEMIENILIERVISKIEYYQTMLNYLDSILKTILNRTYQIKNSIEFLKFTAGYD